VAPEKEFNKWNGAFVSILNSVRFLR